jgi:hypothetical protein
VPEHRAAERENRCKYRKNLTLSHHFLHRVTPLWRAPWYRERMIRVALLLALLLPWQSFAMESAHCATAVPAAAHAACAGHHAPTHDSLQRPCTHCDLCSSMAAIEPLNLRSMLPHATAVAVAALPAPAPARVALDRLDRPPR